MTEITLHGILAKEYGKTILMDIHKPRDIIRAIDCNKSGFRKRVIDLQRQGFQYDILVDKVRLDKERFLNNRNPQHIDFVPLIIGSGTGLEIALWAAVVSLTSVAISYALMDPGTIEGGEQIVSGSNESLIFQGGAANVSSQGAPVPIGYGRLIVGSQVIQSSIKSFPQSIASLDVMTNDQLRLPPEEQTSVETRSNKINAWNTY